MSYDNNFSLDIPRHEQSLDLRYYLFVEYVIHDCVRMSLSLSI